MANRIHSISHLTAVYGSRNNHLPHFPGFACAYMCELGVTFDGEEGLVIPFCLGNKYVDDRASFLILPILFFGHSAVITANVNNTT